MSSGVPAARAPNLNPSLSRELPMKTDRFDIHQHITDKIVNAIESAGEFRLPWHRAAGSIVRPVNVASKKAYHGINVVALWAYAEEFGYSSGVWGTYKQWAEAGAQVRQCEKAAFVVFYKELAVAADPETGDAETAARLFARATPVFAAEQVDGFMPATIAAPPITITTPIEQASFRRHDGRSHPSWRRPGLLSSFGRRYPPAATRSVHRHQDRHAGGILPVRCVMDFATGPATAAPSATRQRFGDQAYAWRLIANSEPPSSASICRSPANPAPSPNISRPGWPC
jgi:hypothetical protein